MEQYDKIFKYINFAIIHIISFIMMYNTNLELIGIGFTFAINIITNIFLTMDIINSPKRNDIVILIILSAIIANFISCIFIITTLRQLHLKYKNKDSKIELSRENRNILNLFKNLFVTNIVLITILSIFFFTLYKTDSGIFLPFFNTSFDKNGYIINEFLWLILKVVLSISTLAISGYMIYYSYFIFKLRSVNVFSVSNKKDEIKPIINKKGFFTNMFENLNINFLSNYKIDLHP